MKTRLFVLWISLALTIPGAAQDISTTIEADDGVMLATDVYLPDGIEPWPAILIRTPYGKEGAANHCQIFTESNISCVSQDLRGFGESGGEFSWADPHNEDGRATVEWIADQTWCDGIVGTRGGSATGLVQYFLAPLAPPALKAIAPKTASPDSFHHWIYQGGALREDVILGTIAALGLPESFPGRLLDESWDSYQPIQHADEITAAGLHMGGWYDIFSQGTLDGFAIIQEFGGEGARGQQNLIIGPWHHGNIGGSVTTGHLFYPSNSQMDVDAMELAWLKNRLNGEATGVDQWPPALVYLMGPAENFVLGIPLEPNAPGNVWLELEDWPPPAVPLHLNLDQEGLLSRLPSNIGQLQFMIDPDDPVPTRGGANMLISQGPRDQRDIESRDDVVVFSTHELTHPVTVMGRVTVRIWILPDTTDLDLAVRLSDVYPTGHSMLVTDGIQRARMRCSDEYECALTPGEPAEVVVDLWSTAIVFNRGHKIRISISGSNWPRFEVNPNHGNDLDSDEPGITAMPKILFGPDYPSRLVLPVPIAQPRRGGLRIE